MKKVTVVYGANQNTLPGIDPDSTIRDLLNEVGELLQIPEDAEAVVSGNVVSKDYVINDGETVTFRKKTGDKG